MLYELDHNLNQVKVIGTTREVATFVMTLESIITRGSSFYSGLSYHIKKLSGNCIPTLFEYYEGPESLENDEPIQLIYLSDGLVFYCCGPKYHHNYAFENILLPNLKKVIERMYKKNKISP